MTTQISADNIQPSTLESIGGGPKISNVQITNSSYVVIDDTAVALTGGYIKITGSGFASGCTVIINGTAATSVSFVSSTVLNVQVGAQSAGTYIVYVTNTDGSTAIRVNGITYSGNPTWVTDSTLPESGVDSSISIQLSATGDAPMTYALQNGSSLPTGLTLSSSGLLSGTITGLSAETTYNFTITATDVELQDSPRSFSITITVGDTYWSYVTTLLSPSLPTLPFNDDASTNNFAITINGDTKPNNFNPYTPGYYSNYFDGTGDYLSAPNNSAFDLAANDFTIEFWFYTLDNTINWYILGKGDAATVAGSSISIANFGTTWQFYYNGGSTLALTQPTISANVWTHIAIVRSGSTVSIYKNGTSTTSGNIGTGSINTTTSPVYVGGYAALTPFKGYISNFRIVKGTAVYTANFTPPTAPLTAVSGTSLLTCQSNRFIDNSTNSFAITKNGDTSVKSFNPYTPSSSYSTYGSTYFDGTGDYLSIASNPALELGSGNYTIEGWWYFTDTSNQAMVSKYTGSGGYVVQYQANNLRMVFNTGAPGADVVYSFSWTPVANVWYHVAITRSGTSGRAFINGVQIGTTTTFTTSNASTSTPLQIGSTQTVSELTRGYVSDLRILVGTALYTANFTPPTSPLTAVANTVLLTCQTNQPVANNTFLDNSTNNFAITRNGNTTQGTFSPYGAGWSNYFDGSGDYLSLADNAAFEFGSGDFTAEAWIYLTAYSASYAGEYAAAILTKDNTTSRGFEFKITGSASSWTNLQVLLFTNNSTVTATASNSTTINLNTWYHVAYVRSGTTVTFYLNGTVIGSGTNATTVQDSTSGVRIGAAEYTSYEFYFPGYISNLRVVKGTAVYTTAFTPSTTPLQPVAGTSLLTCQSPNIVDNSPNKFTITKNGDVSVQKFGPFAGTTLPTPYYSTYFNGTTDYLTAPATGTTTFQSWNWTGSWTIEGWFNFNSVSATKGLFCYPDLLEAKYDGTNLVFAFRHSNGPAWANNTTTYALQTNTWYHIALVLNGSSMRAYVNGQAIGTASTGIGTGARGSTTGLGEVFVLGANDAYTFGSPDAFMSGLISNFRISNIAVYTGNFSIPTSELELTQSSGTNISALSSGQVSLLTCKNNTLKDNTLNNWTITSATTTVKPISSSPFTMSYSTKQSYTPSVFGGSMYFDGTGDYLTNATSGVTNFGTGDFTVDYWLYYTAAINSNFQQHVGTSATSTGISFGTGASGALYATTSSTGYTSSGSIIPYQWQHIAWTRSSGTLRAYLNGVQVFSQSVTTNFDETGVGIGGTKAGTFLLAGGYLSDIRVIKGQALYTSNFVPQNAPLTAVRNTSLLVNGTSSGMYDSSMMNDIETVGAISLSVSQVKYGNFSIPLSQSSGAVNSLNIASSPNLDLAVSGDFTIEFWFYPVNFTVTNGYILEKDGVASTNYPQYSVTMTGSGQIKLALGVSGGASTIQAVTTTATLTSAAWNHVACVRSGTTLYIFINGTSAVTPTTQTVSPTASGRQLIINNQTSGISTDGVNGYISDIRLTKGIARYTANFTPSTAPFQIK